MDIDAVLSGYIIKIEGASKAIFVWYPKARIDLEMIHDENDVLTDNEEVLARNFLKKSKHAYLSIRNEFPRGFRLLSHI